MKIINIDFLITDQIIEITEDSKIIGTFVGKNDQILKSKITFLHKHPNINSRIYIKAVVFDKSRFDLDAMLKIEKGAVGAQR